MATSNAPRCVKKPLPFLQESYDEISKILDHLNRRDLSAIKDDYEQLRSIATEAKAISAEFLEVSHQLSERLINSGAIEEAQIVRTSRVDAKNDCREILKIINSYLSELRRTNVSDIPSDGTTSRVTTPSLAATLSESLNIVPTTDNNDGRQSSSTVSSFHSLGRNESTINYSADETIIQQFSDPPDELDQEIGATLDCPPHQTLSPHPIVTIGDKLPNVKSPIISNYSQLVMTKIEPKISHSTKVDHSVSYSFNEVTSTDTKVNELIPQYASMEQDNIPIITNNVLSVRPKFNNVASQIDPKANNNYSNVPNNNVTGGGVGNSCDKSQRELYGNSNHTKTGSNTITHSNASTFKPIQPHPFTEQIKYESHVGDTKHFETVKSSYNNAYIDSSKNMVSTHPNTTKTTHYFTSVSQPSMITSQSARINEFPLSDPKDNPIHPQVNPYYTQRPYTHAGYNPPNYTHTRYNQPNHTEHSYPYNTQYPNHYYGQHQPTNNFALQTAYPQQLNTQTEALSSFLLTQDLVKKSITPFDGSPTNFWPWMNKIKDYSGMLRLTPLQTLQLYESHTTGDPQKMITQKLASTGSVSTADVADVYDTLVRRYGSNQKISNDVLEKIKKFPCIKNPNMGDQLENLYDLCKVVLYNANSCPELKIMDLSMGLNYVRAKLPEFVQREWAKVGQQHEDTYGSHPPFSVFVDFIKKQARLRSNKNYDTIFSQNVQNNSSSQTKKTTRVMRTEVSSPENTSSTEEYCLFHKTKSHSLHNCSGFKKLDFQDRKKFIYESRLCYICFGQHRAANCTSEVSCSTCNKRHHTAMHREYPLTKNTNAKETNVPIQDKPKPEEINTLCTAVCKDPSSEINCSKTVLVQIGMKDVPGKSMVGYCIIDEQSNATLVDESVVEFFEKKFPTQSFKMRFASQHFTAKTESSIVTGLQVKGALTDEVIDIEEAVTCPSITDTTNEVATPAMVRAHSHTKKYSKFFPEFDPKARVLILIGRNCGRAMATQCLNGPQRVEPYVHKSPLGYSLVGRVCKSKKPNRNISVFRTHAEVAHTPIAVDYDFPKKDIVQDVFQRRSDDDHPGLSIEDKLFLNKMKSCVTTTPEGNLELPLPFKEIPLPNNKGAVYNRTYTTLAKLKTNTDTLNECLQTMNKNLNAQYIEQVPEHEIETNLPTWYLPIFAVSHAKKMKTRLVYDASARYKNISLNDTMLTGPDLNNHLRSVLLRFREKTVAFAADIESMFSTFKVPKPQQDLLRFYWFKENNPINDLVPFRSTSHLFGCSCSPAIANFALKYCASSFKSNEDLQASVDYLQHSFYVDDGVSSVDSPADAIATLSGAIKILKEYKVRLHKIVSNDQRVLDHFPSSELSPTNDQETRILGVCWNIIDDTFSIESPSSIKPYTRRGILSFNNSFYDPIGFISPLLLTGRLFQRRVMPSKDQITEDLEQYGWDDALPQRFRNEWDTLTKNLDSISQLKLNRCFYSQDFEPIRQELHIFSDASDKAIGHVAYIRSTDEKGQVEVAFVTASSKVAPRCATSIPRLELCAAVEAASSATKIAIDLRVKPNDVKMYTDSNIVLGYVSNETKRFTKYVERRIAIILDHTKKEDWQYVNTLENPADLASRPCYKVEDLAQSIWLKGPAFLHNPDLPSVPPPEVDELPEEIVEKDPVILKTSKLFSSPLTTLYEKTSEWTKIVNATKVVLKMFHLADTVKQRLGTQLAPRNPNVSYQDAVFFLVRQSQQEAFGDIFHRLHRQEPLPDSNKVSKLSPYLEIDDTIRVGGRLKNSDITFHIKHPLLIPKNHPIHTSIIQDIHRKVKHQGNHITHNSIISNGFHLEDGRQAVRDLIKSCVMCRKLRGKLAEQFMADLPADRLEQTAPFQNVGLDVFGPFFVHDGINTRRTTSTKKIWVVIFVCLPSRAVHLEPLTGMDTSSFRNALCRFIALRGPVSIIRSDQGTNFIATRSQLKQEKICIDELSSSLDQRNIQWILNPPHASHHGGSWERKIGSVRRVLEASFRLASNRGLSRDEFHTVLSEAACVVNNTPLWTASNDPNDPNPLTPNMLLTLKDSEPNTNQSTNYTERDLSSYGPRRYRRAQYLCDQFWIRWHNEYVHTLNHRQKWRRTKPPIKVGDIVLTRDKQLPRNHWPIARVQSVKTSKDGLVRSVSLLLHKPSASFGTRSLDRPISEVVLLLSADT